MHVALSMCMFGQTSECVSAGGEEVLCAGPTQGQVGSVSVALRRLLSCGHVVLLWLHRKAKDVLVVWARGHISVVCWIGCFAHTGYGSRDK